MAQLSIEEIRQIEEAWEEDVRRKVAEGPFDELRAEANLSVWRKFWTESFSLPSGRPNPRLAKESWGSLREVQKADEDFLRERPSVLDDDPGDGA